MKRVISLALLLFFVGLIVGCSKNSEETLQSEDVGKTVKGDITAIENLNSPALVFFFTGNT